MFLGQRLNPLQVSIKIPDGEIIEFPYLCVYFVPPNRKFSGLKGKAACFNISNIWVIFVKIDTSIYLNISYWYRYAVNRCFEKKMLNLRLLHTWKGNHNCMRDIFPKKNENPTLFIFNSVWALEFKRARTACCHERKSKISSK